MADTTTTPNMGLILPVPSVRTGPLYASDIVTAFEDVDKHDHSTGKGVKIGIAGIDIDGDLELNSNLLTEVSAIDFVPVTLGSLSTALRVDTATNELFWFTAGSVAVQLTLGNGLNTTLVGGITGDYTTTNANLRYDDSDKTYNLLQDETPDHYANAAVGHLDLYEPLSGITDFVRHQSPASLAASYTLTWLAALPGATQTLQVDAAGLITSVPTPLLHGDLVQHIAAAAGRVDEALASNPTWSPLSQAWTAGAVTAAPAALTLPIELDTGERVKQVDVFVTKAFAVTSLLVEFIRIDNLGVITVVGSNTGTASGAQTISITSLTETVAADNTYAIRVDWADVGDLCHGAEVTYDRP